jgi:hypothetical protein
VTGKEQIAKAEPDDGTTGRFETLKAEILKG